MILKLTSTFVTNLQCLEYVNLIIIFTRVFKVKWMNN